MSGGPKPQVEETEKKQAEVGQAVAKPEPEVSGEQEADQASTAAGTAEESATLKGANGEPGIQAESVEEETTPAAEPAVSEVVTDQPEGEEESRPNPEEEKKPEPRAVEAAGEVEQEAESQAAEAGPDQQDAPGDDEETVQKEREEFARLLSESESRDRDVKVGEKVSGVLIKVEGENGFVDFGGRSEGVIRTSELQNGAGEMEYGIGDPLEAFVAGVQDEIVLTRKLTQENHQADMLYQAYKSGIPIEGRVDAVNKWGLGITIQGEVRAFCPISQLETHFVEDAEEYRGKTLTVKIIEFRNQGRNIVVSRRALLEAEKDKEANTVRAEIKKGGEVEGTVTRLENFGAFVNLGAGVEGLIHVSEISHQRVGHPQEALKVGDQVKVAVLRTKSLGNRRKERISLSLKALEKDPWQEIREKYPPGSVLDGKVDALEDFGAFVEVAPGVRGLLHVSEISDRRINHPRDALEMGQEVKVVVLDVDVRRKRLRLSMKQVESMESAANLKAFQERRQKEKEDEAGASVMLDALRRANLID